MARPMVNATLRDPDSVLRAVIQALHPTASGRAGMRLATNGSNIYDPFGTSV
jgi:hypothetical protein